MVTVYVATRALGDLTSRWTGRRSTFMTRTGRPSTIRPIGPAFGDANVDVLVLCVLRTNRAAWIWSLSTTRAPSPRSSGLAAD